MSRMTDLVKAAADALDDGQDPFHGAFLLDNGVTLDECFTLSELLAVGARLVAFGLENPTLMLAAMNGAQMATAYQNLNDALGKMR